MAAAFERVSGRDVISGSASASLARKSRGSVLPRGGAKLRAPSFGQTRYYRLGAGQRLARRDINLAQRALGWEPKVSLEEGLSRTIEYFAPKPVAIDWRTNRIG
jgi:nucleoside-diphosphate-sugar epimerase